MAKLCVENKSVSFARTFVLGFFGNLFYFLLLLLLLFFFWSWDFLIVNAHLKYYYYDFLESFHSSSYKLYKSLQHIIFQNTINFFSRILIDLFSC